MNLIQICIYFWITCNFKTKTS